MEGAFTWIGQLIEWLGSLIPRIKIVRATHAGIKFQRGKHIKLIEPGLIVYWPIITEVDIIPVARQTHNMPTQCAVTKDRVPVSVGGVVVYRIKDVVKALSRNWDFTDTINDIAMTAIMPVILQHTYDELIVQIADGSIQKVLTNSVKRQLHRYGVSVASVALTDFARSLVVNNVGQPATIVIGKDS
jgi:regulator of protease activity HflC (stomatin/prohibitin superfamily)